MGELKKLADDRSALLEEAEQGKKKLSRDIESMAEAHSSLVCGKYNAKKTA